MNLSKGRIGEDNSRLLGGMLITKIQLAAMERVDIPEEERQDFFLYVDEFQNFATPSFANILSEARKYRLGLIMAHQYVAQLDEVVADAVFGNVGTIVTFRVGGADAEMLAKEFAPTFIEEDIVSLGKYNVFLKLMIDGVASQPFSATTLPPVANRTGSAEKIIQVSRERYAKTRADVEDKIMRWSMSSLQFGSGTDEEEDSSSDEEIKKERSSKPREDFKRSDKEEWGQAVPQPKIQPEQEMEIEEDPEVFAGELFIGDVKKESSHEEDTSKTEAEEEEKPEKSETDRVLVHQEAEVSDSSTEKPKKKRKRKRKKKSKENQNAKSEQTS